MTSTGAMHEPPSTDEPTASEQISDCWPDIGSTAGKSTGLASSSVGPHAGELTEVTLRWSDLGLFFGCYAALVVVWFTVGKIVVNSSAITELDQSVADWFVNQRTSNLDLVSAWGSGLADTFVKIGVTALLAIAMRLAWKRWREPLMVVVPLVLEAAAFITVTYLIARPRPEDGLESSPVDSGFPSGHVAAAAAYGALVIIVFWHTRRLWIRALVIIVSVVVPVVVALSRMYRGMHFLSDVVAGAALGVAAVALCWWMMRRAVHRTEWALLESGSAASNPVEADAK